MVTQVKCILLANSLSNICPRLYEVKFVGPKMGVMKGIMFTPGMHRLEGEVREESPLGDLGQGRRTWAWLSL